MENYDNLREYISENLTNSKCAIESLIFLYSNKEKAFVYNEIWEKIRKKVIISGSTPVQTCATEIRRYTENSPISIKRSPSLFKITNLDAEGEFQKFKLMEDIRKKIDIFLKSKIIISKRGFIESLKALLEYSQKILKFLELTEKNKEDLIKEIYNSNDLEYFEDILNNFEYIEGPIQALRYTILEQFIKNRKDNLKNSTVTLNFIEKSINQLCSTGLNGKIFERSGFSRMWTSNFYSRTLLFFFDFKYKLWYKRKILNIIKFLLTELNLEKLEYIKNLEFDKLGRFGTKKVLSTKNIKLNNIKFTINDFTGAQNQFSHDFWIAIYPIYFKSHQEAYQIFFQLNYLKENEIRIGLYPGNQVETNKLKEHKILKKLKLDFNNENLINEILEIYNKIKLDYKKLNEFERKYLDEKKSTLKEDRDKKKEEKEKIKIPLIESHSDAQGVLLEIGNMLGYNTYVAKEDRNKIFNEKMLGDISLLKDIPPFSYEKILETAKHIDIIWFQEEFPVFCFEVEESTSVTKGLNRLADIEPFNVSMFIVGAEGKRDKFIKEINRYSFRNIQKNTKFLDYNKLEDFFKITKKFTKLKKEILD